MKINYSEDMLDNLAGGSDKVKPGSRKINIPLPNEITTADDDLVLVKESMDPLDLKAKNKFSAICMDQKDENTSQKSISEEHNDSPIIFMDNGKFVNNVTNVAESADLISLALTESILASRDFTTGFPTQFGNDIKPQNLENSPP